MAACLFLKLPPPPLGNSTRSRQPSQSNPSRAFTASSASLRTTIHLEMLLVITDAQSESHFVFQYLIYKQPIKTLGQSYHCSDKITIIEKNFMVKQTQGEKFFLFMNLGCDSFSAFSILFLCPSNSKLLFYVCPAHIQRINTKMISYYGILENYNIFQAKWLK